jgi:Lon protease-like protein
MAELAAPTVLSIFPLTGSLLLPGSFLPLNIFEPRYRNMVADAMGGEGLDREQKEPKGGQDGQQPYIGMIQPVVPRPDNRGTMEELLDNPELYKVGCAGRIERFEPQPDGRYHILLRGMCRFRVREELVDVRDAPEAPGGSAGGGYRRVVADYSEFLSDLTEPTFNLHPGRLLRAAREFGERHGFAFELDVLSALPGIVLLNGLAAALPFSPPEKQALLEAAGPVEREELLLLLMGMGIDANALDETYTPPTLH